MKIREKYLRHDSYKITIFKLQFLTTPIDEVIIGFIFVQVSTDLQQLYWVYLRLQKPLVKVKTKA